MSNAPSNISMKLLEMMGLTCLSSFDACYGGDCGQDVFFRQSILPCVKSVLKGINSTVFSYGITGSGKTYSMVGTESDPGTSCTKVLLV